MKKTSLILGFVFFSLVLAKNIEAQRTGSDFHFGISGNKYSFDGINNDTLSAGTGIIVGIELLQGINSWLDISYNFSAGKTDPMEVAEDIFSATQFSKFGVDLHFKPLDLQLLRRMNLEPYLLTGYNLNTFQKIGDGDDFRVRTNTYGFGAGTSYGLNERFKLFYEISRRYNLDNSYTSNITNRFGLAFRLYHPEKSLRKDPLFFMALPMALIEHESRETGLGPKRIAFSTDPGKNIESQASIESPLNTPRAEWESTRIVMVESGDSINFEGNTDLREVFDGHFFVILGAYRNLASAENLFTRVARDVPFTSLLETGLDFYRVGVSTGIDSARARTELDFFRIHGFPDAWLLRLQKPEYKIPTERRPQSSIALADPLEPIELEEDAKPSIEASNVEEESKPEDFEMASGEILDSNVSEASNTRPRQNRGFYVVIASFLDYNNAVSHKNQIGDLGENCNIIRSAQGFFRVASYVGTDVLQAEEELLKFRSDYKSDAWLLVVE